MGRTDAEAEAPILGHLMRRANSLEKTLLLGKIEGRGRRGRLEDEMVGWHHRLSDVSLSKLWKIVKDRKPDTLQSMGSQGVGHDLGTEPRFKALF